MDMKWITLILLGLYSVQCEHEHKTASFQSQHNSASFQVNGANGEINVVQKSCHCKFQQHTAPNQNPGRNSNQGIVCSCQDCVANSRDQNGNPIFSCNHNVDDLDLLFDDQLPQFPVNHQSQQFSNGPQFSQMQAQYQHPVHQQFHTPMQENYQPPFQQYQQQSNFQQPHFQQQNSHQPNSHQSNSHQPNFQQQQHPQHQQQQHHSHRQKRAPFNWDNFFNKISLMGRHDGTYNKRTEGYFHYNYLGGNKGSDDGTTATQTATTISG